MSSDVKISQRSAGARTIGVLPETAQPTKLKPAITAASYQPPPRTLKWVRGPETSAALELDTPKRSLLNFTLSALRGKETIKNDGELTKKQKELEQLKYELERKKDSGKIPELAQRYQELAAAAGEDRERKQWLAHFPTTLPYDLTLPDSLLVAWIPFVFGHDNRRFLNEIFKRVGDPETREVGLSLFGAYLHAARDDRPVYAKRLLNISHFYGQQGDISELVREALAFYLESTKLDDDDEVRTTFSQLGYYHDYPIDRDWLNPALSGNSSEDLARRCCSNLDSNRLEIREAAKERLTDHLLHEEVDAGELRARITGTQARARGQFENQLLREAIVRLSTLTDWTKPAELAPLLALVGRYGAAVGIETREVIARLEKEGLDRAQIFAFACEMYVGHSSTFAKSMFAVLAAERAALDPLGYALELVAAESTKDPRSVEFMAAQAGFTALLERVTPAERELGEAVLELGRLVRMQVPAAFAGRFFGAADPEEDFSRALRGLSNTDRQIVEASIRTFERSVSVEVAPSFAELARATTALVERVLPAAGLNTSRVCAVVKGALDRLAGLAEGAAPADCAVLRRIAEAIRRHDQNYRIPPAHIAAIYAGGDSVEVAFRRAVDGLDRGAGSPAAGDAKNYLSSVLGQPGVEPAVVVWRLERVLDRVAVLGENARRYANSLVKRSGYGRAQQEGEKAKRELTDLVRELVLPSYSKLLETADYSDEHQALFLALAPEPLIKEGIKLLTFPDQKIDQLFQTPNPLPRATDLTTHSNPLVAKKARELTDDPTRVPDLYEALLLRHAKPPRIDAARVGPLFTYENISALLGSSDQLSALELGRRVQVVVKEYLAHAQGHRDPRIVRDLITPAYARLLEIAELDRAKTVDDLLKLPAAFHGTEAALEVPAAGARAIFAGGTINTAKALELIGHASETIRTEAAHFLEQQFTASPSDRETIFKDLRAKLHALQPATPSAATGGDLSKTTWARNLREALDATLSEPALTLARMQDRLIADLAETPPAQKNAALQKIQALLDPSHERDRAIDRILGQPAWLPKQTLNLAEQNYGSAKFDRGATSLLVSAIGTFLGDPSKLIECLEGRRAPASIAAELSDDLQQGTKLAEDLTRAWKTIDPTLKQKILEQAFADLFTAGKRPDVIAELQKRGLSSPDDALKDALRNHALDALERDPDAKGLAAKIEKIFEALPEATRSKMVASLLLEPPTTDAALLIRRLLSAAGVVAIKAGQQMCEDPDVPKRFQTALEDLRDQNERMTPVAMWKQVPAELRELIAEVGRTLGTGSVKQVFEVRLSDGTEALGAVLREGVEEQIANTMGALRVLDDTKHLVDRLVPMLEREIDLLLEAKAFDALRETPVGKAPITLVPKVIAAHKRALIREPAPGEPLSAILRARPLDAAEKKRLADVHRLLVKSALDTSPPWLGSWVHRASGPGTFVLTDPHQGNISDDGKKLGLFDPGQYENLKDREAELFVKMLVAFSKPNWHRRKRGSLVEGLAGLCHLSEPNSSGGALSARIDEAYAETFREPNATVGRKLHLLLLAASKKGVAIPNGYFGLAKMLHSLQSQEAELGLPDVVGAVIKDLYLDQLGPVGRIYRATSSSPR